MADESKSPSNFLKSVLGAAKDASELNVLSVTGDIKAVLKENADTARTAGDNAKVKLDFQSILKAADGDIFVEAYTELKFDGDVNQFKKTDISDENLKWHQDAIEQGTASRKALLDLAASLVGKLVG